MPALALDIGSFGIKAISAEPGLDPVINKIIEVHNTTGVVIPKDEEESTQLTNLIHSVINNNQLPKSELRLSLPETMVTTKIIHIPTLTDAELASAIGWQAEQNIPIPKEELSLEYQVLYRPPKGVGQQMRVLLIGVRKSIIENYVNIFTKLGIEPVALETQMVSLIRSLKFHQDEPNTLVVEIGATNLNLAAIKKGELSFIFTNPNGGNLLTRSLQQQIGLEFNQAEEYKKSYGLTPNQFQGKVREILMPIVQTFSEEIKKAIRYFNSQHQQEEIKRIVFAGGTTKMPGLMEYFAQTLEKEILLASPFASAKGKVPKENNQSMSICMGLLMRNL
jgi:type IV pilus assembly protein PilM